MYFELGYDGLYKSKPGSAFTFEEGGSGYVLTHKDGTVYDFDSEGNIVSITKLDGKTTNFSYAGGKLSSVSTETGTLNFAYAGDYVSSVTDSTGRSVTFSYDGDDLVSAVNPDSDDLQYTYDAYHRLLTIQNFNGEVYLSNQYDEYDRVIEQYVEGEGVSTLPMMEMPESIPVPGKMDIIRVLNMTLYIVLSPIPPTMAPNILNIMKKMNG